MASAESNIESKKLCPGCIKNLPLCLFRGKTFCMECATLRGIKDAPPAAPPWRIRIDERLRQYGLTYFSYKRRYETQGRRCAICSELRGWTTITPPAMCADYSVLPAT